MILACEAVAYSEASLVPMYLAVNLGSCTAGIFSSTFFGHVILCYRNGVRVRSVLDYASDSKETNWKTTESEAPAACHDRSWAFRQHGGCSGPLRRPKLGGSYKPV
jgi:hypothetical protein